MKNKKYRNTIKGAITKTASSLAALALGLTISSGSQATHKQYQHHDIIKINSAELGELPWGQRYTILRSEDKTTQIVDSKITGAFPKIVIYTDKDNSTEGTIDHVFEYYPTEKKRSGQIENNLSSEEFSELKKKTVLDGDSRELVSSYPGVEDFLRYAQQNKYHLAKSGSTISSIIKDPDTQRVKSRLNMDKEKDSLVIENKYNKIKGFDIRFIRYPVNVRKTEDPTIKKILSESYDRFDELFQYRK